MFLTSGTSYMTHCGLWFIQGFNWWLLYTNWYMMCVWWPLFLSRWFPLVELTLFVRVKFVAWLVVSMGVAVFFMFLLLLLFLGIRVDGLVTLWSGYYLGYITIGVPKIRFDWQVAKGYWWMIPIMIYHVAHKYIKVATSRFWFYLQLGFMVYVVKFIVEGPQLIRFLSKYMLYNYKS